MGLLCPLLEKTNEAAWNSKNHSTEFPFPEETWKSHETQISSSQVSKKCQGRSFTSFQMFHTHAPLPRGFLRPRRMRWRWNWKEHENEMTMKMRWQLLNRSTRGGTQKGKGKREHQHRHTWPETGNPERARKKEKADGRRAKNQPEEGGADRSAWDNLQGKSQNIPRHAKDPNLT